MGFAVPADAYDRFMGRYSVPLSPQLADLAGVAAGQRVLDVGCGPGALTAELVERLGAAAVAAVDPSEPFVAAARERHPEVDVRQASAEELPVRGRRVRRRARAARRPLHGRPGRRARRDAARDAPGRRRRRVRVGSRRRPGAAQPVLAGGARARSRTSTRRVASSRARARATDASCSRPPGCATSRRRRSTVARRAPDLRGVVGAVHARRRPGGRLRRGARPGAAGARCASTAARRCPRRRSCSSRRRGPPAASPDRDQRSGAIPLLPPVRTGRPPRQSSSNR